VTQSYGSKDHFEKTQNDPDCQTTEKGKSSENWKRKVMGLNPLKKMVKIARLPKSAYFI